MSRVAWTILVPFCLVLAVLAVVVMVRDNTGSADVAGATGDQAAGTVTMEGLAFAPATLTVSRGTEVLFDNNDVAPHTVTADEGSIESGVIDPSEAFKLVVNEAFTYHCTIHPSMTAEIRLGAEHVDIIGFLNDVTGGNLLLWKVIAATIVFALAGTQMVLAARLWKASSVPPISESAASTAHRIIGRVTLFLAIVVAISCISGPAGPISPTRVLLHSIFGTVFLVTVAAKFTILRVLRKGYALLPFVGTALFLCIGALWATSVADYVSRR